MPVKMPVLLSNALETVRPIKAVGLSLTASLRDRSQAQLIASHDESPIPMRSFIDVYTQKGFFATFRVTNSALSNERGRVYTLTHAIDTLRDSVYQMQGTFEGTKEEFLLSLFAYQKDVRWQLGYVEDGDAAYKSPNINYTKLSDLFSKYLQDNPDVYPSYDFTATPWVVNILKLPTEVSARFSLTRNADTCNIVYDDKNMCNRLYLSVNTPEQINGITKYNAELRVYENAASIAQYGVIEKTASVKTDEITNGDANAWAQAFLEKYAQPEVNITVDGYELYKQTGEIYDEASVSKRATVSLPEYGTSTTQRIESIQYPDVLNAPTAIVVSLATKQKTFTTAISNLEQEVEKVGGTAGGAALSAADAEEVTTWSLIMQKVEEAVNATGIITLWESGIIVDAVTGNKIYSLEQGFVSAFTEIANNSREITIVAKEGQNNASAITANAQSITALSQTVDENNVLISGVSLRLDNVETEVEILAQKQVSLDQYENRLATAESSITANTQSITLLSQTVDENETLISGVSLRLDNVETEVEILAQKQVSIDQYENRLATAESSITANAQSITLLSQTVDENEELISGVSLRLDNVETEVEILVKNQVSLDEYENRLATAESSIKVNADNILLKADQSVVDALSSRVSSAEIDLDAANAAILLKANQTVVDALSSRVSSAEIDLDAANAAILLKANQTTVDALSSRVSSAEIDLDAANAAILLKANQTTVNALGTRVSEAEIALDAANAEIALKVNENGVISAINLTTEAATISASKINLQGYVTASQLSTSIADVYYQNSLAIETALIRADQTDFGYLSADAFTLGGGLMSKKQISMGPITTGQVLSASNATLDLTHSHNVSVSDDGTVTLGAPSVTGGNFKIADTKVYKDGVSAAKNSVTATLSGWSTGTNTVTLTNNRVYPVSLPSFTARNTAFDASTHKATVHFYSNEVNNAVLYSHPVDATSVYEQGLADGGGNAEVTLSPSGWSRNINTVSAYSGDTLVTSINIAAPEVTYEFYPFNSDHIATIWVRSEATVFPVLDIPIDASGVYDEGYKVGETDGKAIGAAGVTMYPLNEEGWVGGVYVVRSSNGKNFNVNLPSFNGSAGAFNASHKAIVTFTTASVNVPLKSVEVDASSVYDEGYAAGWAAAAAIFDMSWDSASTANSTLTISHAGATPESADAKDTVRITSACEISNITNPSPGILYAYSTARAYANVNGAGAIQRAYATAATQVKGSLG